MRMWNGGYLVLSFINPLNFGFPVKKRTMTEPLFRNPYFYVIFCWLSSVMSGNSPTAVSGRES